MEEFEKELAQLINKHSRESGSDTPDFILASYLVRCLIAFNMTMRARSGWYGQYRIPDEDIPTGPKPVVCKHENTIVWEPHLAGARKCNDCEMVYNPNHSPSWFFENTGTKSE